MKFIKLLLVATMFQFLFTGALIMLLSSAFAQQYASGVIAFSSEYSSNFWSAQQALGSPDTYPNYGDHSTAWASLSPDGQREFLELSFSVPEIINQVWVYETYNPGALDTVYVRYVGTNSWVKVWDTTAAVLPAQAIIRKATFLTTPFPVDAVRLAINSPAVPSWNEIDAVAIYNSNLPTSISEQSVISSFTVFPNPSRQGFTVSSFKQDTFLLFDVTGRQVDSFEVIGDYTYRKPLLSGMYVLKSLATSSMRRLMVVE